MFDLIGLTNALADLIRNISDAEVEEFNLKKGFYTPKSSIDYKGLVERISSRDYHFCIGGSPANVVQGVTKQGLKTGLIGVLGEDEYGYRYYEEIKKAGIHPMLTFAKGKTGTCNILVTPDGERSIVANIGVAANHSYFISPSINTQMFHTSAYEFCDDPRGIETVINHFKTRGAEISFDLADPIMVEKQRAILRKFLPSIDILFMTEEESYELTGYNPEKSLELMSMICHTIALKKGKKGSTVRRGNEQYDIPIIPVDVVNTNGAGDAYAAGFLAAYLQGRSLEETGLNASRIAARVCAKKDPHL